MRKRNNKNTKKPASYNGLFSFVALAFFIAVITAIFIIRVAKKADFFKVKEINVLSLGCGGRTFAPNLDYLKNKNIFSLDLKAIGDSIKSNYFFVDVVRVSRFLPGRLIIQIKEREAAAVISLGSKGVKDSAFYVDKNGMLLDIRGEFNKNLILITGLENRLSNPKSGRTYYDPVFLYSLELVKMLVSSAELKSYKVNRVNIKDETKVSIFISPVVLSNEVGLVSPPQIEAVMPVKDLNLKLKILARILNSLSDSLSDIEYIDLRFNEPIVKKRIS